VEDLVDQTRDLALRNYQIAAAECATPIRRIRPQHVENLLGHAAISRHEQCPRFPDEPSRVEKRYHMDRAEGTLRWPLGGDANVSGTGLKPVPILPGGLQLRRPPSM